MNPMFTPPTNSPIQIGSQIISRTEKIAYYSSFHLLREDLIFYNGSVAEVVNIRQSPDPDECYVTVAFDKETIRVLHTYSDVTMCYNLKNPEKFFQEFFVLKT